MKINTHSLIMYGLKRATSDTREYCRDEHSPCYLELFYDRSSGEIWTIYQYSIGHNAWTIYHNENIVHCGNLCRPMTMQEIADLIYKRLQEHNRLAG